MYEYITQKMISDEEFAHDYQSLDLRMHLNITDYKKVVDAFTHGTPFPEGEDAEYFKEVLQKYIDIYGMMSFMVNSLFKMAVDVELPRSVIVREYCKTSGAAAFNKSLIAKLPLNAEANACKSNMQRVLQYADLEDIRKSNPNCYRMMTLMRKYYRRYMSNLTPKIYTLVNDSGTRIEDYTNITDINGIAYCSEEDVKLLKDKLSNTLRVYKILNLEMEYIDYERNGVWGSINVAPDDSGKTRISYSIDPIIQVVSKAVSKSLEYVAKKLACNCTYDQMRVIRSILRHRWNENALIVSTDMSKYSDTLQFGNIHALLVNMGVDSEVAREIWWLYNLDMYDSARKVRMPGTSASYQGQYGDFAMITLMNLYTQAAIYDMLGETMYLGEDEKEITNGAVGDDTIMVFFKSKDVLDIVTYHYNYLGVNINPTKTHILDHGEGFCDFIKRMITREGLVPYIRLRVAMKGTRDEKIEELLRLWRDNLLSFRDWRTMVELLCPEDSSKILRLHVLNGGVYAGPIEESDVKLFCLKNERIALKYKKRTEDNLRKWISLLHSNGYRLMDTALLGWADHYQGFFDEFEDEDLSEYYTSEEEIESEIEENLLKTYRYGYEEYELSNLQNLIGLTMDEVKEIFPEAYSYWKSYCESESYRSMMYNGKKVRKVDVYSFMFDSDLSFDVPETVLRSPLTIDHSELSAAQNISLMKHQLMILERYGTCSLEKCWYTYHYIYTYKGVRYRLYKLERITSRSLPLLPFEKYTEIMGDRIGKDKISQKEHYANFISGLSWLDYES